MRQKSLITKEQKKQLKIASIVQDVQGFINKNDETYAIIASSEDFFVMAKKKTLQVHSRNTNNIFQPRESIDPHTLIALFILTFENKKHPFIDVLKKLECPVIHLLTETDIKKMLESL
jgi:hypothetical protein